MKRQVCVIVEEEDCYDVMYSELERTISSLFQDEMEAPIVALIVSYSPNSGNYTICWRRG